MSRVAGIVPPPPGEEPDFDLSKPWKFKVNIIIITIGLVSSTLFLAMRIYTRTCLMSSFGWDDVSMIIAWLFSLITQVVCIYGYEHGGVGIHLWNVTPDIFDIYQKTVLAAAVVYVPALAFAKIGLIILYHRIINKHNFYRWILHIISAVVCAYSIAIALALIFACNPVQKGWDSSITRGYCIDRDGLYIATAVTNIVTDIALILVPLPLVISLQIPRIQKVGLSAMFIVGCATFITSILRLVTLIPFFQATDITYQMAEPELWINIEANLIIICPCLPFIRRFLRYFSPAWIGETSSSSQLHSEGHHTSIPSRKHRLGPMQDEIALTENAVSIHRETCIIKNVQWEMTEERLDADMLSGINRP